MTCRFCMLGRVIVLDLFRPRAPRFSLSPAGRTTSFSPTEATYVSQPQAPADGARRALARAGLRREQQCQQPHRVWGRRWYTAFLLPDRRDDGSEMHRGADRGLQLFADER